MYRKNQILILNLKLKKYQVEPYKIIILLGKNSQMLKLPRGSA